MNNLFQENKKTFLFLLGLLVVLLLVVFYLFYRPIAQELKSKTNEEDVLVQEVELLKIELANKEETEAKDKIEQLKYAQELPVHPELENMIRQLEAIEFVSKSRFESIGFSYDGTIPERLVEEQTEEDQASEENTEEEDAEETETEEQVTVIDMEEKPENLHVITMSLQVTSPNFEQFQTFVKEIEKQERMMVVSNMSFDRPLEQDLYFQEYPDHSIEATITVATFYYE